MSRCRDEFFHVMLADARSIDPAKVLRCRIYEIKVSGAPGPYSEAELPCASSSRTS